MTQMTRTISQRRLAFAISFAVVTTGCVSGDETVSSARFSLVVPTGEVSSVSAELRDESGYYDLSVFPAFVYVQVTASDMEMLEDSWPTTPEELVPGPTEVEFLLAPTPGEDRTLSALAYVRSGGVSYLYVPVEEPTMDLSPGDNGVWPVSMSQSAFGSVLGTVGDGVIQVAIVDESLQIIVEKRPVANGAFAFPHVPVGRTFSVATRGDAEDWRLVSEWSLLLSAEGESIQLPE